MSSPIRILLVEDNPVDVRLLGFALAEESAWEIETTVAEDGERAIDYLRRKDNRYDLVVLDLNLPKRDGIEVLNVIRSTESLSTLPVIILSSAPESIVEERMRGLNLFADAYVCKPVGASDFMQLGTKLRECYRRALGRERARGAS